MPAVEDFELNVKMKPLTTQPAHAIAETIVAILSAADLVVMKSHNRRAE